MDYSWRLQHVGQPKSSLFWTSIASPGFSYVTHVLPLYPSVKWKREKLRTRQRCPTNPTHPSEVWSESLSSQGTATDELEDADRLLGPVPSALHSGEDTLLGEEELCSWEEDDRRVGMVVQLRERAREGGRLPAPPRLHPQPWRPPLFPRELLWNSGSGGPTKNKMENTL